MNENLLKQRAKSPNKYTKIIAILLFLILQLNNSVVVKNPPQQGLLNSNRKFTFGGR